MGCVPEVPLLKVTQTYFISLCLLRFPLCLPLISSSTFDPSQFVVKLVNELPHMREDGAFGMTAIILPNSYSSQNECVFVSYQRNWCATSLGGNDSHNQPKTLILLA